MRLGLSGTGFFALHFFAFGSKVKEEYSQEKEIYLTLLVFYYHWLLWADLGLESFSLSAYC